MARPVGATHKIVGSIQASQVDATLSWWTTLLSFNDLSGNGASFITGLQPDLSDFELTLADVPVPWKRIQFDQTPGAEKLKLWARLPLVDDTTDTELIAWRGCTAPVGEKNWADVMSPTARLYMPMESPVADVIRTDRLITTYPPGSEDIEGVVGLGQRFWETVPGSGIAAQIYRTQGEVASGFTMSIWWRPTTWEYRDCLFRMTRQFNNVWADWLSNRVELDTTSGWQMLVQPPLTVGEWHHATVTLIDGTIAFYQDGIYFGGGTWDWNYWQEMELRLGFRSTYDYDDAIQFNGVIDEVYIHGDGWNPDQIKTYDNMLRDQGNWFVLSGHEESLGAEPAVGVYRPWLMTGGRMR